MCGRFLLCLQGVLSTEFHTSAIMATIMKLRQCQPHDWHITTFWPPGRPGGWAGGTQGVIGDNYLLHGIGGQAGRGRRLPCAPAPPPRPSPACRAPAREPRPHDQPGLDHATMVPMPYATISVV